jgi:hypothetical protein
MDLVVREFVHLRPNSHVPILYADDVCATGEDPAELQRDVDVLCAAFARHGMSLNVQKTKYQVFRPPRNRTTERNYAEGTSYTDFKKRVVTCDICDSRVAASSLKRHQLTRTCLLQAGADGALNAARDDRTADLTDEDDETILAMHLRQMSVERFNVRGRAYFYDMPQNTNNPPTACCLCRGGNPATFTSRTALQQHMKLKHDAAATFEPLGKYKFSRYVACDLCQAVVFETQHARAFAPVPDITVGGDAIARVSAFKYLGVWITCNDLDEMTIAANKVSACRSYGAMRHLIKAKGLAIPARRMFVDVVCASALLYGCETWALTQRNISQLRTAQQSFYRPISGLPWTITDGRPVAPATDAVLKAVGGTDVENKVRRRRLRFAMKVLADPQCLAHKSAIQLPQVNNMKVGKGYALHPEWLSQVMHDAHLCGVVLWVPVTSEAIGKVDSFHFVDKPLHGDHQ